MKFTWITNDGKTHEKFIVDREDRLKFIEGLETDLSIVLWW